ncbi:MAG: glycosyltransferase, partial [Mariprofundaceae bacterium]
MSATIAVVISTYNSPALLRLILDGYQQQTGPGFTIYIADDGSTEETKELVETTRRDYPADIVHVWHEDAGFRKARIHNLTLQRVAEPYVLLTDGDCVPLPGLLATHDKLAGKGYFISGRRVLASRRWTETLSQQGRFEADISTIAWLGHRLRGRINRILPLIARPRLGLPHTGLAGIRGCHLGCWLDDLRNINGFDESFEGWGREDSDLVARLMHAGVKRRDLAAPPMLHLWHAEHA